MFHRKLYLNFNIFFMKQLQDLANEFPNLVCYVYYWTLLGVKRAGGPSSPNMMGTLESAHSSWNCANIYKLVRQYFAPCLFNQRAFVAIFLLIYGETNAKLSPKTGQEILVSFWRKDVGHIYMHLVVPIVHLEKWNFIPHMDISSAPKVNFIKNVAYKIKRFKITYC